MDFIDFQPIALQHTPLGTRNQLPVLHERELDWHKLAALIRDNGDVVTQIDAGLAEDWLNTHGTIWNEHGGYRRYPNDNREFDGAVFGQLQRGRRQQFWLHFIMKVPVPLVAIGRESTQIFTTWVSLGKPIKLELVINKLEEQP